MKRLLIIFLMTFVLVTSITANAQNRLFLGDWYGTWNYSLYNETLDRYDSDNGKTIVRIDLNGDSFSIRIKEVYSLPGEPEETLYWPDLDIVSFDDKQITAQYEDVRGTSVNGYVQDHNIYTCLFILTETVLVMTRDRLIERRDHSREGWPVYNSHVHRWQDDPVQTGAGVKRQLKELRLYKTIDW